MHESVSPMEGRITEEDTEKTERETRFLLDLPGFYGSLCSETHRRSTLDIFSAALPFHRHSREVSGLNVV